MDKKTARIAFRVEAPVLEALENLADAQDVSISHLPAKSLNALYAPVSPAINKYFLTLWARAFKRAG